MKGGVSHSLHSKKTRDVTILVTRLFLIDKSVIRPEVSGQDAHTRKQRGGVTLRGKRGGASRSLKVERGEGRSGDTLLYLIKNTVFQVRGARLFSFFSPFLPFDAARPEVATAVRKIRNLKRKQPFFGFRDLMHLVAAGIVARHPLLL